MAKPKKNRSDYEAQGEVVWEVPTREKVIALTFDDGPDPDHTPAILDLLKQYDAKATFFVVGNKVDRSPEITKRELDEGHELANHTYSHMYFSNRVAASKMKNDILKAEDAIYKATGQRCRLFRPPGGFYNENLISIAKEHGYLVVMWSWSKDSKDWRLPGVSKIVSKVLSNTQNGEIVLFHDYAERQTQTLDALKIILPKLKEEGFRFITVSELLTYRKNERPEIK
nr:polysaccharide deacetylase family protein [Paenibacillus thalictri]